jgi:hypothetical protein
VKERKPWLQKLKLQAAKLEAFMYTMTNNEEYIEVIKSIENKVHESLLDKKRLLQLAMFSLIRSMRSDPGKYSALMYHNNDNQSSMSSTSRDNCNLLNTNNSRRQVVLQQAPYDYYIIEDYKAIMLEETEKLYNVLVDPVVCEVTNESFSKQPTGDMPSLPDLSLQRNNKQEQHQQQKDILSKGKQ